MHPEGHYGNQSRVGARSVAAGDPVAYFCGEYGHSKFCVFLNRKGGKRYLESFLGAKVKKDPCVHTSVHTSANVYQARAAMRR